MITLNDYLYSGDTVLKILQRYHNDLKEDAKKTQNGVDMIHCNFLLQLMELLEHNDFLTSQSQRLREFYKYMSNEYPFLAFTFKGRIKSLIRAEQKFNGNIVEHVYDYYAKKSSFPNITELKQEIGPAYQLGYEKRQDKERSRRDSIPSGECTYFDEAYERGMLLQGLDLSKVDVNMFGAVNNQLVNDGCGLYRGRLILPYEHLSRFQNDIID